MGLLPAQLTNRLRQAISSIKDTRIQIDIDTLRLELGNKVIQFVEIGPVKRPAITNSIINNTDPAEVVVDVVKTH